MKPEYAKAAIKLTLLDAIEKGHTARSELIEFMKSKTFQEAAKRYAKFLEEEFGS